MKQREKKNKKQRLNEQSRECTEKGMKHVPVRVSHSMPFLLICVERKDEFGCWIRDRRILGILYWWKQFILYYYFGLYRIIRFQREVFDVGNIKYLFNLQDMA